MRGESLAYTISILDWTRPLSLVLAEESLGERLNQTDQPELEKPFPANQVSRSFPFLPALLAVNPNAWLPAVQTNIDVRLASPTLEFGVAGLLARLASSVFALSSHRRQSLLGLLTVHQLLENFSHNRNRGLFSRLR